MAQGGRGHTTGSLCWSFAQSTASKSCCSPHQRSFEALFVSHTTTVSECRQDRRQCTVASPSQQVSSRATCGRKRLYWRIGLFSHACCHLPARSMLTDLNPVSLQADVAEGSRLWQCLQDLKSHLNRLTAASPPPNPPSPFCCQCVASCCSGLVLRREGEGLDNCVRLEHSS